MPEALKPYLVPAMFEAGGGLRIVIMATPTHMEYLKSLRTMTVDTTQATEALTLTQQAELIQAIHDRDAALFGGGLLQ